VTTYSGTCLYIARGRVRDSSSRIVEKIFWMTGSEAVAKRIEDQLETRIFNTRHGEDRYQFVDQSHWRRCDARE